MSLTRQTPPEPNSEATNTRRARIALYSHDTMGLGHMRRNLLLAQALCASPLNAVILMIAGAREAAAFTMPPGVDCLTLPALSKDGEGQYSCRHMPISLQQIVSLRSAAIRAALDAFEPDVLVVDNVPRGAVRELDPTLTSIRARGRTRLVLGLRDVLDDPVVVRAEWRHAANEEAILDYYDAIWVYGDRRVCDPAVEYGFSPEVAQRVRFAGYLDQRERLAFTSDADDALLGGLDFPPGRLVLGAVGGGQDGERLADAFTQAELPRDTNALLLTGPFMPEGMRRQILRRADRNPRLRVLEFVREPAVLLHQADRIVAMGGYSTTCEILSFEKHALIVPRVTPRLEQFIRAQRLTGLGLVHSIHPDEVTPERIARWIARDLGAPSQARSRLDFGGLRRVPELLQDLLDGPGAVSASTSALPRTCHASA
jgi:predicted glycosyltransferase